MLGTRYIDHLIAVGKIPEKEWDRMSSEEHQQLEKMFSVNHALDEPVVYFTPRNKR